MPKILGIDYGEKRLGLALSDEEMKYAFASQTIDQAKQDVFASLQSICQREGVETVVVGLPLNQEGKDGLAALAVKNFSKELEERLKVKVIFEDERFSTTMASALLRESGKKSKAARSVIDQNSARIILQTYLDRFHNAHLPDR